MHSRRLRHLSSTPLRLAISLAVVISAAVVTTRRGTVSAQAPDQLTIYSVQSSYSVPLLQVNGQPYAGLVDMLEPLGSVDARPDGKKYKLSFTAPGATQVEAQFTQGKEKAKVRGENFTLASNFAIQNGRGYVPLSAAPQFLTRLLGKPALLHAAAHRLFIGDVAIHFSVGLDRSNPPKLVVSFPAQVNPTIATEPGRMRLIFHREPVVANGPDTFSFNDPLISGATFSEHDGLAELDISATAPLTANFADGGKTLIVTAMPPPPPAAPPASPPAAQTQAPATSTTTQHAAPSPPRFLVILDPAHGGNDSGAAITPSLAEKDVVLTLARRVQRELGSRGIAAALLRTADAAMPLDQRAVAVNGARPALYIALHAANTGRGVHVFTSLLPATNLARTGFLPWDTAQAAFLDLSGSVAGSVAAELENRKLPYSTLVAPLRPMNNIAAPAIAIELAPPDDSIEKIASPQYEEQVAQSIAAGVAAVRTKLPEVRP